MRRTVVLDVVGLTPSLVGDHTPNLKAFASRGATRALREVLPAVTATAHATFTTGTLPRDHGAVANGWYFRDLAEVWLWRQSNRLVGGEKLWDEAKRRDPGFTCAQLFWWFNMYADVDYSATPRPMYPADGRKLPDVYTEPPELRAELTEKFGTFPLFHFWGPNADIRSTQWVADASRHVYDTRTPTLSLIYLPHLDYGLQRLGPNDPAIVRDLRQIDAVCGELIQHFEQDGARVVILSEYGIGPVTGAVDINRVLRRAGLIRVRDELGQDKLDPGACEAFAVADHQIAHVYVRRPERVAEVKALLEAEDGIEMVLGAEEKAERGLDHPRSGELVAISRADRWFTYYFWVDPDQAPDYARTVDIHRKPGYDPVELFADPEIRALKLKVGLKLAQKALGFRYLMDVVPLDASLVKGSHGRPSDDPDTGPLLMSNAPELLPEREIDSTSVRDIVLAHVFEERNGFTAKAQRTATTRREV